MVNMSIKILLFSSIFFFISVLNGPSYAQENTINPPKEERLETVITTILEEKMIEQNGKEQLYQKLELLVTKGSIKGKKLIVENGIIPVANVREYEIGDNLMVTASKNFNNKDFYYITDYVRRSTLYLLFALFTGLVILVGRKRGLASLAGMAFSFFVIFSYILPQISYGKDPIRITIMASLFIIPVTFYLSHGINRKTTAAIIGTVISLIITGVLANIFVDAAQLSGFASEEANFVEGANPGLINIRGLLLAGIIIGVLGILDDITISQAAIVYQLKHAAPTLSIKHLFSKAMDVGRDHIASVVNTLVLVYTGAALPLLLLFINSPVPFSEVINYEIIAEEIVRTLVASIGLILAVPITTFLTAYFIEKKS